MTLTEAKTAMQAWGPLALFILLTSWTGSVLALPQETSLIDERKPTFDVVSVRQIESYKEVTTPTSRGYAFTQHKPCVYSEDKVLCQLSLEELIREAYQRRRYEVTGPKWLGEDVFVFQAMLAEKTSKDDARLMMQAVLEDRFELKSHLESKPIEAYVLVAGPGGQRLTPADPPDRQKKIVVNGGPPSYVTSSAGRFAAAAISLDKLGPWVERSAGLDRPVLNGTGLDGQYKIELKWNPSDDTDSLSPEKDTGIVDALKRQAGLVLRKQNVPADILVIDHVNRTPTPN